MNDRWTPPRGDHHEHQGAPPLPPPPDSRFLTPGFGAPPAAGRAAKIPKALVIVSAVLLSIGLILGFTQGFAPAGVVREGTDYTFIAKVGDLPVRWNPCVPIHYVVNLNLAPPDSLPDVQEAVAHVADATGIKFIYDGMTQEEAAVPRDTFQPDLYGDRWAPVLIDFVHPEDSALGMGKPSHYALGVAQPETPYAGYLPIQFVTGEVEINADYGGVHGFAVPGSIGLVVQHEMGHIVGMGHVHVQGELMNTSGGGMTGWGPGDEVGLRLLGRSQGCLITSTLPRS